MMNWPSFEKQGINDEDPLFQKLWITSRALNDCNPFSDEILNLNNVQMDFIIRKFAKDHPDEYKIIDKSIERGENPSQIFNDWSDKFTGKTRQEFDRNPIAFLKKHYNWVKK